jgi:hypothetical protein
MKEIRSNVMSKSRRTKEPWYQVLSDHYTC